MGGIYLSSESRRPYFDLKNSMQKIIDNVDLQKDENAPLLTKEVAEDLANNVAEVLERGKLLRDCLTNDIGTRRGPFV